MTSFLAGIVGEERAKWIMNALERLVKTWVQVVTTLMTASTFDIASFGDIGFWDSVFAGIGAATLSVVMSWLTAWATNDKSNTSALPVAARP